MKKTSAFILCLAVSCAAAASINPTVRDLGEGEACDYDPAWCAEGLSCVGNVGNRKCFAKKMVGMRCGQDPFWVCEDGLICEYNVCVKPPIGVAGSCNNPDDVCEEGLSCVGNEGNMKCFAKKMLGMRCGQDPFWVCEDGLICEYNVCVKPPIGVAGSCNNPDDVCEEGLSCVGNEGNMKCFAKKMLGMRCGQDPFWVCEDGLLCKDNKCAKAPIGRRGSCNEPDDVCEEGLSCLGDSNKRCFPLRRVNRKCGNNPFQVCEEELVCDYNICRIPMGGSCKGRKNSCATGLSCLGTRHNRRCFAKRKLGEKCGEDPFWVCEDGLACKRAKCAEH